jgi:hypothetical protein
LRQNPEIAQKIDNLIRERSGLIASDEEAVEANQA